MAEKLLNTRIQLKYDTLEHWQSTSIAGKGANLVLKQGELGICYIPAISDGVTTTAPTVLFKVGDGTKTFAQLPWASGLAADVYNWAKASTKPSYSASEITNFNSTVKGIKVDSAIAADSANTATTATKVNNSLTIGGKTFNGSAAVSITASDLGIANVMHFIGKATNTVTDGGTQDPGISGYTTKVAGDIILDKNSKEEYIWTGSAWENLGDGSSYVVKETGKGLSTNDFTNSYKNAVDGISTSIATAINNLDKTVTGAAANKTLASLSETNGVISATFQNISITKSQVSDFAHTHNQADIIQAADDVLIFNCGSSTEVI